MQTLPFTALPKGQGSSPVKDTTSDDWPSDGAFAAQFSASEPDAKPVPVQYGPADEIEPSLVHGFGAPRAASPNISRKFVPSLHAPNGPDPNKVSQALQAAAQTQFAATQSPTIKPGVAISETTTPLVGKLSEGPAFAPEFRSDSPAKSPASTNIPSVTQDSTVVTSPIKIGSGANQGPAGATPPALPAEISPPPPTQQTGTVAPIALRQDHSTSSEFEKSVAEFAPEAAKSDAPVDAPKTSADPKVPRLIAEQLAAVARNMPDRPVEIALNPEELGRVRMTISATDTSITVNLTIERPETADLMRRSLGLLGQEFRDLGYRDVRFSFSGDGFGGGQSQGDGASHSVELDDATASAPDTTTNHATRTDPTRGMDIRF